MSKSKNRTFPSFNRLSDFDERWKLFKSILSFQAFISDNKISSEVEYGKVTSVN